jgi:hypothetical protein
MRAASLVALLALFSVVAVVAGEEEASVLADTEEVQYSRCEFQVNAKKCLIGERRPLIFPTLTAGAHPTNARVSFVPRLCSLAADDG